MQLDQVPVMKIQKKKSSAGKYKSFLNINTKNQPKVKGVLKESSPHTNQKIVKIFFLFKKWLKILSHQV